MTPSCVSLSSERGLANWPAMRPTFTTGRPPPKVSTTAICSSTRKVSRILSGWNSAKLSAQSPPCSRKALPSATLAELAFRLRASPAKTSGGIVAQRRRRPRRARRRRDIPAPGGWAVPPAIGRPFLLHLHDLTGLWAGALARPGCAAPSLLRIARNSEFWRRIERPLRLRRLLRKSPYGQTLTQ